jgi:hypothetical protein
MYHQRAMVSSFSSVANSVKISFLADGHLKNGDGDGQYAAETVKYPWPVLSAVGEMIGIVPYAEFGEEGIAGCQMNLPMVSLSSGDICVN